MMNRRHFLDTLGVGSLVALAPLAARAASLKRVVVVGGGMAGATAAKYLRLWSNKTVDVTLVDTSTKYVSNIMSNLVVTGQYAPTILDYGWSNLVKNHGVKLLNGSVTQVEPGGSLGAWKVTVTKGTTITVLYCERVVLAPGVKFDAVASTVNPAVAAPILHAWEAGTQTTQLRDFLAAMPPTGTFVLTIPKAPYRCPPGPYERACVVADYLKRNKPGAQIVVLDANQDITAEKESFSHAFAVMYGSNLSYRTGLHWRQAALTPQITQQEQQFLRTSQRERGDDDVALPTSRRVLDDEHQFVDGLAQRAVKAVAVGGLDHQHIGLLDGGPVAHDRPPWLAQVAGEHQLARAVRFVDPDLQDGRTDDVPGISEAAAHGFMRLQLGVVGHALDLLQTGLGLCHGVQQLGGRTGALACTPVRAQVTGPVWLLDEGAVQQHHCQQVGRGCGHLDRPAEAKRAQARQQAAVVDVAWLEGARPSVCARALGARLDACRNPPGSVSRRVDEKARARHFLGGTDEADSHRGD
jgi:hypothetical protein